MLKHRIATVLANMGVSIGMPSDQAALRDLLSRLHPVTGGLPLIRLGADGDGGYVLPDDFAGIRACFSPGVDDRATFEMELARRGIECFLADASCSHSPVDDPLFHFLPKYLGVVDDDQTVRLDTWVGTCAPGGDDLLLQMDIEGAEWPVLLNVSDRTLRRFRIIVLEAHFLDRLFDREGFTILSAVMQRLLQDFALVHNHPNNYGGLVSRGDIGVPRALEMTFLRKDRVTEWHPVTEFPHPLDQDNSPDHAPVVLPRAWRAGGSKP